MRNVSPFISCEYLNSGCNGCPKGVLGHSWEVQVRFQLFSFKTFVLADHSSSSSYTKSTIFFFSFFEMKLSFIEKAIQVSIWQCDFWQDVSHKGSQMISLCRNCWSPLQTKYLKSRWPETFHLPMARKVHFQLQAFREKSRRSDFFNHLSAIRCEPLFFLPQVSNIQYF